MEVLGLELLNSVDILIVPIESDEITIKSEIKKYLNHLLEFPTDSRLSKLGTIKCMSLIVDNKIIELMYSYSIVNNKILMTSFYNSIISLDYYYKPLGNTIGIIELPEVDNNKEYDLLINNTINLLHPSNKIKQLKYENNS